MIFEKGKSVDEVIIEIEKYEKKLVKLCPFSFSKLLGSLIFLREGSTGFQKNQIWREELTQNPRNKQILDERFEYIFYFSS